MGCCSSQNKGQKEEQKTIQQQQPQQQVQEPPKQAIQEIKEIKEKFPAHTEQNPQDLNWFKEQQRNDAKDFKDFDIIGGLPKSSKYEGRVQVFEVQKKIGVKAEDVKIEFGTGLKEDHVSKTVGAVKTLQVDNQEEAQKIYERLKDVKEKLQSIQNEKIINFNFQVTKSQGRFFIDIFMPYAPFGTLEQEIQKRIKGGKRYFNSKEIETFMDQSLRVFQSLQDKNIQHMDIKPHNFLLIESNSIDKAKISDFRAVPDFISAIPRQASEHFEYLAPRLREQTGDTNHYPYKSDLFSLGLTWLRVSTLQDVRGINNKQDIEQRLQGLNVIAGQQNYSDRILKNITKALTFQEESRPDFQNFESTQKSDTKSCPFVSLYQVVKDKNIISSRLVKQQEIQDWDIQLYSNRQGISVAQNKNSAACYPVGDEEEHLEDQSQQINQSDLDQLQILQAQQYGGQYVDFKSVKSQNNQTNQNEDSKTGAKATDKKITPRDSSGLKKN